MTKDGEISPVVQSQMGYHILRRDGYQEAGTIPFEEVQDQLQERLRMAKLIQEAEETRQAIMRMAKIEQLVQFPQAGGTGAAPGQ